MHQPEPENAARENEVEITDLDSLPETGKGSRGSAKQSRLTSFRARAWIRIAVVVGLVLLFVTVLVNVSHVPKTTKMAVLPVHINYPVSLTEVNGIGYATSPNGVVTSFRVSDGTLLWRHTGGSQGEKTATVVDGIIYLTPFLPSGNNATVMTIDAFLANDGSPLWSHTLAMDAPMFLQDSVVNKVIYIRSAPGRIDALRTSDGSLLWHYTSRTSFVSQPSVAGGMVYVSTQDGHLSALQASDGFPLWHHISPNPSEPFPPVVADGMVYLSLQNGSMDVLSASTGILFWRYTPRTTALQLYPFPLIKNGVVYVLTQDGHLPALRANDGFTLWSVALHATDLIPPVIVTGEEIYIGTSDNSVYALHQTTGSVIWHHQGKEGESVPIMVDQSVIYFPSYTIGAKPIVSIIALRASDGFVLWSYTPHTSYRQLSPVVGTDLVLIALDNGSIDAVRTRNGSLRWHRPMNS